MSLNKETKPNQTKQWYTLKQHTPTPTHTQAHTQHTYPRTHAYTQTYYLSLSVYIYGEMVDFGKSDEMIKISGKMNKSNTYKEFSCNISFFIQRRTSSD